MSSNWEQVNSSFNSHGFIYDGSQFTTIDPANSELTGVRATDGRRVAGYFVDTTGTHGFVWNGTNFTTLNDPRATGGNATTEAYGIDGTNIVGYYSSNNIPHGFLYNGVSYTTIDYPGATYGTYAQGIDGTNIVGLAYDIAPGSGHSFLYNGKTFTTITNTLGAFDAFDISGNAITGYYYTGSTDLGFIWDGTNYTTLSYPGAKLTAAAGIDGHTVAGYYLDSSSQAHGFIATYSTIPVLSITSMGQEIVVSWPAVFSGWTLQTNANLSGGTWGNYAGTVVNNTATNTILLSSNLFFRLVQP